LLPHPQGRGVGLKPVGKRHEQRWIDAKPLKRVTVSERVDAHGKVALGLLGASEVAALDKHLDDVVTADLHHAASIVRLPGDAVQRPSPHPGIGG